MERGWLEREFTKALVDWHRKLADDEWYFDRVRNRLTDSLSSEEAFNAIDEAVNVTLAQNDQFLFTEAMELILSLADRSATAEMPPQLSDRWTELMTSAGRFGTYQGNINPRVLRKGIYEIELRQGARERCRPRFSGPP